MVIQEFMYHSLGHILDYVVSHNRVVILRR